MRLALLALLACSDQALHTQCVAEAGYIYCAGPFAEADARLACVDLGTQLATVRSVEDQQLMSVLGNGLWWVDEATLWPGECAAQDHTGARYPRDCAIELPFLCR